jgi:hypothetical protein
MDLYNATLFNQQSKSTTYAMKMIIVGEKSGRVRDAFRLKGHNAISCDLHLSDVPGPHIQIDNDMHLKDVLYGEFWDFVMSFLPCTRLVNSGWWYILKHGLQDEVYEAAQLFNLPLNCPAAKVVAENPVQNKLARQYIRKYDQTIQPYEFGENASKKTCLWLKGVSPLVPTSYFPPRIVNGKKRWSNQTDGGWNKLPPSLDRGKLRAVTYQGIADAMANQWG